MNYCFLRLEALLSAKAGPSEQIARTFALPFRGEVIESNADMGRGTFEKVGRPG